MPSVSVPTGSAAVTFPGTSNTSATPDPPPTTQVKPRMIGGRLNIGCVGPEEKDASDLSKFSHIIVADIRPTSGSDPALVMYFHVPWSYLTQISSIAHSIGVKVLFNFYGGDNNELGSLIDAGHLNQVVANIVDILKTYNLDGVDIDWESGEPQAAMSTFLKELGPEVHALQGEKIVTVAASWYRFDVSLAEVDAGNVDYIMPMCYDLRSLTIPSNYIGDAEFDILQYRDYSYTTTGAQESYADTVGIMQMWIAGGFPKSKLLPGIQTKQTDAKTAAEIALWTVSQGLGGNMIFLVDGVDGTEIVSSVYNVLISPPVYTTLFNASPTPTLAPSLTPISPPSSSP